MLPRWSVALGLGVVLLSPISPALAQSTLPHGAHVPGELLIGRRVGVSDAELEDEYKGHGGKKIKSIPQINVHHIKVPDHALEKVEAALKKNPKVEFVERNSIGIAGLIPNDPGYASQWHLPRISAPQGWNISTGSPDVVIAVLDSGVDPNHPDLSSKLVPGYNYVSNNNDTHDVHGHGTKVAGVAAASSNSGIGIAGVAWQNKIMPLVVFDSTGYSTYSQWISGIIYAADHGAKVISMSIGGTTYSSSLQNAVNYAWNKGAVLVAAAGNESRTDENPEFKIAVSPPAVSEGIISVAALGEDPAGWVVAPFSNTGALVAGPGVNITSAQPGGGLTTMSGTSMAAPHVSGALAAFLSVRREFIGETDRVKAHLIANCTDLGREKPHQGAGLPNLVKMLVNV